jgi:hypothetical protein
MEDLMALGLPESALRSSEAPNLARETPPGPTLRFPAELAQEASEELQAVLTLLEEALEAVGANPGEAAPRR